MKIKKAVVIIKKEFTVILLKPFRVDQKTRYRTTSKKFSKKTIVCMFQESIGKELLLRTNFSNMSIKKAAKKKTQQGSLNKGTARK